MQDKSSFTNSNHQQISEDLQAFINGMMEEVVLKGANFDTSKKWLHKYLEAENVSFENYEKDFLDLLQLIADYRQTQSSAILRLMNLHARSCFISADLLQMLINSSEGKQCIAHEVRLRKRGQNGHFIYFLTRKRTLHGNSRLENERQITPLEYVQRLAQADPSRITIHKQGVL